MSGSSEVPLLCVGDAASSFDPVSGQGILKALRSGVFASYAVADWLRQGDARGHWDGDVLVVETTNFGERTSVRGSDAQLRLVERFRRIDAKTLDYQFTVNDPSVFARPWTVSLPMNASDGRIYEYACHEGNYAMTGILRGARAQEKEK